MPKVNGPGEGVGKLETRSDGINGDGMSPRMFPRLARVDSGLFGSGGGTVGGGSASSGSGVSAGTPRGAKGGKGGGGGDGGFSNLAEYLTKKLELQRTESDACGGSELSFGSSLSRDSSCGPFGDVPLPTGGVSGSSGKKGKGTSNSALSSLLYSRKLEGIEQRLKTVKEQTDEELENFTSDCRRALGSDSISEAEQFLYASLMEVAESVQALSLDDLRSNAQNSLEPSVNELQLLRHKSHGIEWSGQSPVMRLVIIVAKLSRVAEQFRPSESSPLSGIGLNPDAAADSGASTNLTMSAIPLRVFGVDIDMITSASRKAGDGSLENAHQQLSSDNLDNSDRDSERGSQDSMSRANSATGSPQQLSVRQGGGWNLPSQVLMLLPRALKKTVQMGGGVDEEVQTFLTIPMVPGADLAERWRARRRLNLKEDMVICRICEENQKLSQFEDHTNVCAKVAMSTQAIIQINQRLMKYAAKIDRRARENHSNGTKRSPKQVEKLTRLAEICVMPERNTLTREHLQFAYRQANTFDEFCLPGGLLTEEMIQEFVQEISIIIQQAEIMRDTLILGVAKRVRGELDNLLSAFKQLCDEGWKNVSEESKKRVEDDANINEKMSGNNAGRNRVGQLRRVIKAASLRNSPVLPSIDSGRNCLIPSITDFEILKPISRGAFGKVYLARKKTTGDIFAIKAISKTDMLRKNLVARVRAEKDILAGVANPFIVRFFWSFHSQSKLFLVMEYLTGGDMYSLLCNLGFLDEKVSRQYIGEIVLAIEYLHRMNIVHRDIKPDNILIGIDGHIKLTDFGLSRFGVLESNLFNDEVGESGVVGEKKSDGVKRVESVGSLCVEGANEAKEMVGTPDYLAPELLLGKGHSFPVDWWALGVLMYEFLMGIPPFHDSTPENIFENILNGAVEWPVVPDEMSEEGVDLLKRLLDPNPDTRIGSQGTAEIRNHPFFEGIDWDTLREQTATFIPEYSSFDDTSYFTSRVVTTALSMDEEDIGRVRNGGSAADSEDHSSQLEQKSRDGDSGREEMAQFEDFSFQNLKNLEARNLEVLRNLKTNPTTTPPTKQVTDR